jgi:YHS domain-containing protein
MVRIALLLVLFIVVARAFWRVVDNVIEAATGEPRRGGGVRAQSVAMARDPICGTFVVRERALSLTDGATQVFFCSDACREQYRARALKNRAAKGRTA